MKMRDGMGEGDGQMPQPRTRNRDQRKKLKKRRRRVREENRSISGRCGAVRYGTVRSLGFEPKQIAKQAMPFLLNGSLLVAVHPDSFWAAGAWAVGNEGARKDVRGPGPKIGDSLGQVEVSS